MRLEGQCDGETLISRGRGHALATSPRPARPPCVERGSSASADLTGGREWERDAPVRIGDNEGQGLGERKRHRGLGHQEGPRIWSWGQVLSEGDPRLPVWHSLLKKMENY